MSGVGDALGHRRSALVRVDAPLYDAAVAADGLVHLDAGAQQQLDRRDEQRCRADEGGAEQDAGEQQHKAEKAPGQGGGAYDLGRGLYLLVLQLRRGRVWASESAVLLPTLLLLLIWRGAPCARDEVLAARLGEPRQVLGDGPEALADATRRLVDVREDEDAHRAFLPFGGVRGLMVSFGEVKR